MVGDDLMDHYERKLSDGIIFPLRRNIRAMERVTRTNAKRTTNQHGHPPGKEEHRFERNVDHRLRENYIVKKDNHYTKL